jgi:hypothetical protein
MLGHLPAKAAEAGNRMIDYAHSTPRRLKPSLWAIEDEGYGSVDQHHELMLTRYVSKQGRFNYINAPPTDVREFGAKHNTVLASIYLCRAWPKFRWPLLLAAFIRTHSSQRSTTRLASATPCAELSP